jgi:hypothetical protein
LYILVEEGQEGLHGVENALDDEDGYVDGGEDMVLPEGDGIIALRPSVLVCGCRR